MFAYSPSEWAVLWTAVGTNLITLVGMIIGYLKTLSNSAKIDGVVKVTDATHTLVNSNMGVALRSSSVALRRVADLTGKPEDDKLATAAEKMLSEHESRQAVVDSSEGKKPTPP